MWKLKKVLYGLRSGPTKWGEHRDQQLREAEVSCGDKKGKFVQTDACKNVWKVVDENGEIVAQLMIYVDDVLIAGEGKWVRAVMEAFQSLWECTIGGVLAEETDESNGHVCYLNFLGVTLDYQKTYGECKLTMHQKKYILSRLAKINLLTGR